MIAQCLFSVMFEHLKNSHIHLLQIAPIQQLTKHLDICQNAHSTQVEIDSQSSYMFDA